MLKQGGYLLARALKNEGVKCIFTLCGGHIQPIYSGCVEAGIKIIDVRHEQAAAHAADGWARITREPGVAVVTAGPGTTNAVTGIANAMRAGSPMIVIGGQSPTFQFGKGALQEMNCIDILKPITKSATTVLETRRIPEYVSAAFRQALAGRPGPVFLEAPLDVLMNVENEDTTIFPENGLTKAKLYGDPAGVEQAAGLLRSAATPVIMAGSAIWWDNSGEAIENLAEKLPAPIYANGMARGCINPRNRLHLSHTRGKALGGADVVLVVGAEFDFRLRYGEPDLIHGNARIIHINIEANEIGRNRAVDVGIVGDTQAVIAQICDELGSPPPSSDRERWIDNLTEAENEELARIGSFMESDSVPIHPARLCREIDDFLDNDALVVGDGGDIVSMGAGLIRPRAPGHWLDPGPLGCLGMGAPFGLAAAVAKPDKQLLLLYGDGSFGFNGMEMDTAIRFGLPMVAVIGNDGGWGQMRMDARAMGADKKTSVATELGFTRYDKMVEALGGFGEYVEKPSDIKPALERAFSAGKPACINVKIDPEGTRQVLAPARGMAP
jgi:acetolactate synthase-1/2/3 large subunit